MAALLAPDVLVLAGGGTVGEAWMTGVLAGIEATTGIDLRRTEQLIGTSAGSIVAAWLASGRSPRRPDDAGDELPTMGSSYAGDADAEPAEAFEAADRGRLVRGAARAVAGRVWDAAAPLASPTLTIGAGPGALARSVLLARVPDGGRTLARLHEAIERLGVRFDGRLRVVTVDRATGRRVVFGAPGAPPASVADAVTASCSIPWVFRPVRIGGREYVDGGVWSMTNLDVAFVGRGSEVLCLSVVSGLPVGLRSPLGALRAGARVAEAVEAQALRRRGAHVRIVGPDAASAEAIGPNLMDARRADAALAAGYRQGLRLGAG